MPKRKCSLAQLRALERARAAKGIKRTERNEQTAINRRLPQELFDHIGSFLPVATMESVRRSSRLFNNRFTESLDAGAYFMLPLHNLYVLSQFLNTRMAPAARRVMFANYEFRPTHRMMPSLPTIRRLQNEAPTQQERARLLSVMRALPRVTHLRLRHYIHADPNATRFPHRRDRWLSPLLQFVHMQHRTTARPFFAQIKHLEIVMWYGQTSVVVPAHQLHAPLHIHFGQQTDREETMLMTLLNAFPNLETLVLTPDPVERCRAYHWVEQLQLHIQHHLSPNSRLKRVYITMTGPQGQCIVALTNMIIHLNAIPTFKYLEIEVDYLDFEGVNAPLDVALFNAAQSSQHTLDTHIVIRINNMHRTRQTMHANRMNAPQAISMTIVDGTTNLWFDFQKSS